MANEDKMFELMSKMYGEMQEIKTDVKDIKKRVTKIEVAIEDDIKPTIKATLDGYKANSEKLTRIEQEVSKHDEFIMKRIK